MAAAVFVQKYENTNSIVIYIFEEKKHVNLKKVFWPVPISEI